MVEIVSTHQVEFISSLIALFGVNESGVVDFLISNINEFTIVLDPLS